MRKNKFFRTAGEKRKFYRNMEFNRSARQLGFVGLSMLPMLAPLALFAIVALGLVAAFSAAHSHETIRLAGFAAGHKLGGLAIAGSLGKAREMREQRVKLITDAQALIPADNKLTPEVRTKFDTMMADADVMKADIDRIERSEAATAELRTAPPANQPGADGGNKEERKQKFEVAFRNMLRDGMYPDQYGFRGVSEEERAIIREYRDMGTAGGSNVSGATGGAVFVPEGFVAKIEKAQKFAGQMLEAATIMTTATGQPLPYPTDNDTSNTGELVGENAPVTTQDVTIGNVTLGAFKASTKMVKVSIELLQDSAFDVDSYLAEKFGIRLGRLKNNKCTVGVGTTEPFGIVTQSTLGATAAGSATNDGSANDGTNSIGTDDLVALEHSVDVLYREGAAFMANDATIKFLKQLKDKYGRPIFLPGIAVNAPDSILGYRYFVNNDMDTIAASKKTVLFGQLKKYLVRSVKELSVLRLVERFAEYGQVAFIGFSRFDGNLIDAGTHPVKYLQQHA